MSFIRQLTCFALSFPLFYGPAKAQQGFVKREGHRFVLNGNPYYFTGTNYWYGGLLGLEQNTSRGIGRLQKELDFLVDQGVSNLRVMVGVEGAGQINGVSRVEPPLQPEKGKFDPNVLRGLDILLSEMGKRNMKAVLFLSNNWEWSGGFLQYLNWNGKIPDVDLRRKINWDELRDYTSLFYSCQPCRDDYLKQVDFLLSRVNTVTGKKYTEDPAIMTWELANEPRPMRPAADNNYRDWIRSVAKFIRSKDANHLIAIGHEGGMGVDDDMKLFEDIHAFPEIDYLTIHIWAKNWSWFKMESFDTDMPRVLEMADEYISRHEAIAKKINKPLVIEEFGLPRDGHSFSPSSSVAHRDRLYEMIFGRLKKSSQQNGVLAGLNFWAFGGIARPVEGQTFWEKGNDYLGDPPMEEQGLNTVFDSDHSTWKIISENNPTPVRKVVLKH